MSSVNVCSMLFQQQFQVHNKVTILTFYVIHSILSVVSTAKTMITQTTYH